MRMSPYLARAFFKTGFKIGAAMQTRLPTQCPLQYVFMLAVGTYKSERKSTTSTTKKRLHLSRRSVVIIISYRLQITFGRLW